MLLFQTAAGSWLSGIVSGFQQWSIQQFANYATQQAIGSLAPAIPYLLVFIFGALFTIFAKGIVKFLVIAIAVISAVLYYAFSYGLVLH